MKASITRDGYIKIEAETNAEAFAMKYLQPTRDHGGEVCHTCGQQMGQKVIFSTMILEGGVFERRINGPAECGPEAVVPLNRSELNERP